MLIIIFPGGSGIRTTVPPQLTSVSPNDKEKQFFSVWHMLTEVNEFIYLYIMRNVGNFNTAILYIYRLMECRKHF